MIKTYLNSMALLTPILTDMSTGALEDYPKEMIRCQVVDMTEIAGNSAGRTLVEGSASVVIVDKSVIVKAGDKLKITSIRGVAADRPERIVKSVSIVGGFRASHKEVLI